MRKYTKKSVFAALAISLICTMFNFALLTQDVNAAETTKPDVKGLELHKTATSNSDGTYNLRLEAYAEGEVEVITKSKPLDIVLVLDQSGSMADGINPPVWGYIPEKTPSESDIYFIQNDSGDYENVIYFKTVISVSPPFHSPIIVFKKQDGTLIIPNSCQNTQDTNYPVLQFYGRRDLNENKGTKKMEVLQEAATSFVDEVIKNGGNHRIAMVGYASGDKSDKQGEKSYLNTELFIGSKQYGIYNENVDGGSSGMQETGIDKMYSQALQSTTSQEGKDNLKRSIKALTTDGATRSDLGMEMAKNIFEKDTNTESDREKVVIMFTDGTPTDTNIFSEEVANKAIETANGMKSKGVKVFTVGVENTLDINADPNLDTTTDINKYMQYVSSNYPNAKSLNDAGTEGDYKGMKFLSADDEESLLKVFDSIREEISSSSVALDETTQLVDYVSDYFKITSETDVKAFTQEYNGKDSSNKHLWKAELTPVANEYVKIDTEAQKISVTGFDYSKEFIATDGTIIKGKRLILELKVKVNEGFIGGIDVPTNKETSGIYDKDSNIAENFEVPKVDVKLNFDLTAEDKSVYVATKTGLAEDFFDANRETEGIQYTIDKTTYDFNGINNAFVDVTYDVKVNDAVVATYTIKAGEKVGTWEHKELIETFEKTTPFTVEAKVSYKGNTNVELSKIKNAKVNVFAPSINSHDSVAFKGETISLNSHIDKVEWVSENTEAKSPTQKAPDLSFGFSNKTLIMNVDHHKVSDTEMYFIKVVGKDSGKVDYTKYTKFTNDKNYQVEEGQFKVTVVKGELEIKKEIGSQYTDKDTLNSEQSIKFKIERRDEKSGDVIDTYYQTIQFSANENITSKSIVLKGLSKGYYTVTEVDNWSWKYDEEIIKRNDNYIGNGQGSSESENSNVYIGDNAPVNTGNKIYYGSESNTNVNGKDESNPASVYFCGNINEKFIVGDVASAINKFTGK